jgi:hypothetical protein
MTTRMGTSGPWFPGATNCRGYGAGFYVCDFDHRDERGRASITFTRRGAVVKVTAIECLVHPVRRGCRLS